MEGEVLSRIAACERAHRRLRRLLFASVVVTGSLIGGWIAATRPAQVAEGQKTLEVLRVREIVVVDERGVVRVRIGGDLPDAVIQGRNTPRGDGAAGVLLYDTTGQERGGYVTLDRSGYIGLTLDSRYGQTAVFRADSSGSTALRLWTRDNALELRSDKEGARLSILEDAEVVLQLPEITDPASTSLCADLRSLQEQHSAEAVLKACLRRMPASACHVCLQDRES